MLDICVMLDTLLYFKGFQGIIMPDIGIMCDIIAIKNSPFRRRVNKKGFEFVCKPSSVVYGHLSRLTVTDKLKRYSRYSVGRTALYDGNPILQRVGFTWHTALLRYRWALTSPFHPYRKRALPWRQTQGKRPSRLRRFISVALSRRSPSPDVIRHPVLCSSDFPHDHLDPATV